MADPADEYLQALGGAAPQTPQGQIHPIQAFMQAIARAMQGPSQPPMLQEQMTPEQIKRLAAYGISPEMSQYHQASPLEWLNRAGQMAQSALPTKGLGVAAGMQYPAREAIAGKLAEETGAIGPGRTMSKELRAQKIAEMAKEHGVEPEARHMSDAEAFLQHEYGPFMEQARTQQPGLVPHFEAAFKAAAEGDIDYARPLLEDLMFRVKYEEEMQARQAASLLRKEELRKAREEMYPDRYKKKGEGE